MRKEVDVEGGGSSFEGLKRMKSSPDLNRPGCHTSKSKLAELAERKDLGTQGGKYACTVPSGPAIYIAGNATQGACTHASSTSRKPPTQKHLKTAEWHGESRYIPQQSAYYLNE